MLVSWLFAPAYALSCLWGAYDANVGDQVVPENVQIIVNHTFSATDEASYTLVASDGTGIALTEDRAFAHATLTPTDALVVGETYTIMQDGMDFGASFEVAAGLDEEAPAPPEISSAERLRDRSEWGLTEGVRVEISALEEDAGLAFEYQLSESDDFGEAKTFVSRWTSAHLGNDLCSNTVPGYDHSADYVVRVRAIDLAGNVSDWTDSMPVRSSSAIGCSTGGGAAPTAWLALALLAFVRRHRAGRDEPLGQAHCTGKHLSGN